MSTHNQILQEIQQMAITATNADKLMQEIADRIHSAMARYNWVGFYLVDKQEPQVLVVGPYTGSFIPNARIPFGQGMCGAAAVSRKTIVANNVAQEQNYLAGSEMVKSEIVVPISVHGKLAGEIDVESYFADTFSPPADRSFVESVAAVVGKFLEKHPS
jgi:L-methionine (R)-S-oxide reductase